MAGLCCSASSFYPGFDVCRMGWSLFICLLGFPCFVPLCSVPMLRHSHSLAIALPCFPPSFPVGPCSYQGCFLPALCKITSLSRCWAGFAMFPWLHPGCQWGLMFFTPQCISHLAPQPQLCGRSQVLSGSQAIRCSCCWGRSFASLRDRKSVV